MRGPRTPLSKSNEWATEDWLFAYANRLYGPFDLDVAAAKWNAKCARFLTKKDNALVRVWGKRNWCNSPYSTGMKEAFAKRGRTFVLDGTSLLSCHLLPHDTADGYWRRCVEAPAGEYLGVSKHRSELGTVIHTI